MGRARARPSSLRSSDCSFSVIPKFDFLSVLSVIAEPCLLATWLEHGGGLFPPV